MVCFEREDVRNKIWWFICKIKVVWVSLVLIIDDKKILNFCR